MLLRKRLFTGSTALLLAAIFCTSANAQCCKLKRNRRVVICIPQCRTVCAPCVAAPTSNPFCPTMHEGIVEARTSAPLAEASRNTTPHGAPDLVRPAPVSPVQSTTTDDPSDYRSVGELSSAEQNLYEQAKGVGLKSYARYEVSTAALEDAQSVLADLRINDEYHLMVLNELAVRRLADGRINAAQTLMAKSDSISATFSDTSNYAVVEAIKVKAKFEWAAGDKTKAMSMLKAARKTGLRVPNATYVDTLNQLADWYVAQDRKENAQLFLQEALELVNRADELPSLAAAKLWGYTPEFFEAKIDAMADSKMP